jgi:hypothetical protein
MADRLFKIFLHAHLGFPSLKAYNWKYKSRNHLLVHRYVKCSADVAAWQQLHRNITPISQCLHYGGLPI